MRARLFLIQLCLTVAFAAGGAADVSAHARITDFTGFNPSNDFTLINQDAQPFNLKDHRGQSILLFFGFLTCPDVCPLTLSKVSRVYSMLDDEERAGLLTAFISVDPERDTPPKIKEYLSYFNINAVGLTGSKTEIDTVVDSYKAYYEKTRTTSALGYLIDHTAYLYLIGPDGRVRYLFRPEDDVKHMLKIIRGLEK